MLSLLPKRPDPAQPCGDNPNTTHQLTCGRLYDVIKHPTPPLAILWDYDGTLVDTQPIWRQVDYDIVSSHGHQWSEEQEHSLIGISGLDAGRSLIHACGGPGMTDAQMDELRCRMVAERVASQELLYRPGAYALIEACAAIGLACALFSASPRFVLDAGLARMPAHWFEATISGYEISRPKPDPQGYLLAAERLGVDPRDCLVIEDSLPGIQAGLASGAGVLAIPCMTPLEDLPGQVLRDSLTEVTLDDLPGIWREARLSASAVRPGTAAR